MVVSISVVKQMTVGYRLIRTAFFCFNNFLARAGWHGWTGLLCLSSTQTNNVVHSFLPQGRRLISISPEGGIVSRKRRPLATVGTGRFCTFTPLGNPRLTVNKRPILLCTGEAYKGMHCSNDKLVNGHFHLELAFWQARDFSRGSLTGLANYLK